MSKVATDSRKHILFLMGSMAGGGAERATIEILKHLDPVHYQLSLALFRLNGEYIEAIPQHVQVIDLSGHNGRHNLPRRIWSIRQMAVAHRPDVIISSVKGPNCDLMRASPFLSKNCRLVITEQNNTRLQLEYDGEKKLSKIKKFQVRFLYSLAHRVIAVSQGIKEDLAYNFGIPDHRIVVIQNPVDIERVQKSAKAACAGSSRHNEIKKITAVGRLVPQKGFDDLLRAFALVRKQVPSTLTILGQGPLREALEHQIKYLGLDQHVKMPGFVQRPWSFMAKSDLCISSSRWEGFPLTLLEMLAAGAPVIATDCDYGPREIIEHGKNGLLVPVGDVKQMAEHMVELLSNEPMRRSLAEAGKKYVQAFDSRVIAVRYAEFFENLVS